ncbi:GntR family transcriptional regulator [Cronobacter dublinensis]|uniref:GntR family transcriptional regulator n=1 Tax=Cronobacter dublinensis TaxID=413497 RepID=UPI00039D1708|nr:GntR family transcriptional regulator [Cronobacter dublinensis]EKF2279100.1 GntR family transcriptional regulator [Cronobacter dublinensis]EKF2293191.1 GntR family transcriptional regulator [Cronobacter dublinensis]EKF2294803.1 GntR family transcriptional regulator [Cronobacter dublinensis]EKF2297001.1 GntR family transcriptional regulator [Cronobacter dublinensis]EKK5269074.1 GntR family transcriptional regulator [Cronobacter dublinensis]
MLDLEKAQRLSLTMQVEVRLKNALIVGSLRPGARLVTKEIADQLGISITPVREALLRLVSSGALNATPAQAFLVPEISEARYDEVTKIRKNLEGMAVEAAAAHITPARMEHLRELCDAFRDAKLARNVEQALQANRAFRFQIYSWAEMPTLVALIEQLWMRIGPCFNYLYPQSEEFVRGHHNYDDLLAALEAGDSAACVRAIHQSINDGASILKKQYFG